MARPSRIRCRSWTVSLGRTRVRARGALRLEHLHPGIVVIVKPYEFTDECQHHQRDHEDRLGPQPAIEDVAHTEKHERDQGDVDALAETVVGTPVDSR